MRVGLVCLRTQSGLVSVGLLGAICCGSFGTAAWGLQATEEEIAVARQWAGAHFAPVSETAAPPRQPAEAPQAGLVVQTNHGRVLVNGRPDGRRLKIGNTEYARGLLCHAVSKIVVRLPAPGQRFTATVGVNAHAGGGSVVFSVTVAGAERFHSGVLRGGAPGLSVSVDLAGGTEFTIAAGDAGDGIACDYADWADARVLLADGKELWLSDLPLRAPEFRPRAAPAPPFSFVYGGRSSNEFLGRWKFPYYGSGMTTSDTYWFRSCIFPASRIGWDTRNKNLDYCLTHPDLPGRVELSGQELMDGGLAVKIDQRPGAALVLYQRMKR